MANEIQELLKEIKDERLRSRLSAAVTELRKVKKYGLVFEKHVPELLPIYNARVQSHSRVARRDGKLLETFIVHRVADGVASVIPEGGGEPEAIPVAELVVVKRFGDSIFPVLRHVESVLRGAGAPHHALIEADNYHALQLLEWLYPGKVDCIYIDPPYNSGARDWKYNNDYVDGNDGWRHSKWLAFMEKRLRLAKRLLNPDDSILIVTIDEKEFLRLGLLLEQTFPEARIQMISSVINPKGVGRANEFSRTNEFIFVVWFGAARILPRQLNADEKQRDVEWQTFRRRDIASARGTKKGGPSQFYPVYVNKQSGQIEKVGEALPHLVPRQQAPEVDGCVAVFPVRPDGTEMNWAVTAPSFRERLAKGYARAGSYTGEQQPYIIQYLKSGPISDIEEGRAAVVGRNPDGSVIAIYKEGLRKMPTTQWDFVTHYAEHYGTNLMKEVLPNCNFPFPKSVYAVCDVLRFFVGNKPNALILDFFSGSGTTFNAVALLNAADSGQRRCILVTNNEVSAEEADALRARGIRPSDDEWERHGICRSITFPRCKFTINGKRDDGSELTGDYLSGSFEDQDVRRSIRPLDFVAVETLASLKAREALASVVGFPRSKVTGTESFLLADGESTAVLLDPNALDEFIDKGEELAHQLKTIYLPFPSGRVFNEAKESLVGAWPKLIRKVEIKWPMKDGFASNLAYFRLEFMERSLIETNGRLADILPSLWMMAGCRGELPSWKGSERMLFFDDCPFAVLIDESAIKSFLATLEERPDVDWIFLVTNDQDSFSRMCEWLPEHIPPMQRIHLWRNYVDNFLVNTDHAAFASSQ